MARAARVLPVGVDGAGLLSEQVDYHLVDDGPAGAAAEEIPADRPAPAALRRVDDGRPYTSSHARGR